ncbi:DUF86 domain-containing protein [Sporosarcina sp. E16_3]|uniref:type VII toxin-antitoxin system HepT family RNase toxin n=1 Tax=Sporosarcina sp. E16_3 TaxID=2789293 RepID=UPI001A92F801|nr:DUF86 domain-containing protein [Sporosarcina sp. E16_3]MBO0603345.1 DUF86 domain-containing protein [Sporosarcina sp. E16_3]
MMNDIISNKISVIERCLVRINVVYDNNRDNLTDYTKQDSIVLNIQRACQACIDLAMHVSALHQFGLPHLSKEAFDFLHEHQIITAETVSNMKAMIDFRDNAIPDAQTINTNILNEIIKNHLGDFTFFTKQILAY